MDNTTIELGTELFYLKMSEYALSDWTMKIEARINKVKIKAHYEEIGETHQYSFNIGTWHFNCTADSLFATIEEAKKMAELMKSKIEIIVVEEIDDKGKVEIWPKPE